MSGMPSQASKVEYIDPALQLTLGQALRRLFGRLWRSWGRGHRCGIHVHNWWRECRIQDPPVDIYGCLVPRCERRRYVALGKGIHPDDVHDCVVNRGGSPANAINVITGMKMGHFASAEMNGLPPPILLLNTPQAVQQSALLNKET